MTDVKSIVLDAIECAEQARTYPVIRGQKYQHGFDCGTYIGKIIWCIANHPEIRTVVDFFANTGSGAILSIAHAQQESNNNKVAYSVERNTTLFTEIDKNLEGYKNVNILKGDIRQHASLIETLDIDLVTYDPDDDEIQQYLFELVKKCRPKIWIYHNINYSAWYANYLELISCTQYIEIGKGVSPELTFQEQNQEFSILVRSDLYTHS